MSTLTVAELEKLEKLSKIPLTQGKEREYIKKLGDIVSFISILSSIDTEGIEPISQVTGLSDALREDSIKPSFSQDEVLKNSKHAYRGYFKVPKVIE